MSGWDIPLPHRASVPGGEGRCYPARWWERTVNQDRARRMSRGSGLTERAVLTTVTEGWVSVDSVLTTLTISPSAATRSERESVRRAIRSLTRKSLVRSRRNERGEIEVTEALDPVSQAIVDQFHAIEAEGGNGVAWLKQKMTDAFR
jgi:hypothetical protein